MDAALAHQDGLAIWRNGAHVRRVAPGRNSLFSPAVILWQPKYPHNVGQAVRLASCYGVEQVWMTGNRVPIEDHTVRLPREERMRNYGEVSLVAYDRPFDCMRADDVPVAVEVRENAESLVEFEHPANAVYIFGPEDGTLPGVVLAKCHRFVRIPTRHCLNLATAVATVLYDRLVKRGEA